MTWGFTKWIRRNHWWSLPAWVSLGEGRKENRGGKDLISLPLPSGTFLGSSSSGHNLGDFKGQWKFCHLLPFSLIRKHQVWNRFHSSLYYSIEKIHLSGALLRAGISSYEQVACKTWPKVAVLSSFPPPALGQGSITGSRQGIQKGSHHITWQVPSPKPKGCSHIKKLLSLWQKSCKWR